ncbi:Antilisterial bacteriocin subtilosin biosynthesis protein AlbE [Streptococcus constellatus]|uniref:Antilisterial bacteriocin subtilosin biosynthesis protein AlbE n=1 Tax=Streptococcus constellatus TaxID=76860 RepID=A0A564T531_STRCV|nr:pitrilysin family protein [Streptococcus constellatus]VUX02224.1 Antilisterial bacteriocin subtilosin biosynthesis protein AlbE [Streptococcus constellatus]VUX04416.1 Antilisterial bacteriocin subtilosin biosynthesis protein AlbE [Streptococcus gordonii]
MELVSGVDLHFITSKKFKTNRIKMRFSAPMSMDTIAGRVLAANMLETANEVYPTAQIFRERLANLYGANFSTRLSRRGLIHYVDLDISFVSDAFLSRKNTLTGEILDFLKDSLLKPLANGRAFNRTVFEVEKKNVLNDLKAEIEDHFYHAHQELNKLFYAKQEMQISRIATLDLVEKETPESSFAIFQEMLQNDKIDIFFMGDFNEIEVCEHLKTFGLQPRQLDLHLHYHQEFSNVLKEGLKQNDAHQSIIELGYHFSIQYGDRNHIPLVVLNGLLGGFAHSKLFVTVREKESLAYTISSSIDIFSGMMRIYAGIDRKNRTKTVSLIYRQIADLKNGRFTDEDLNQTKKMLRNTMLLSLDRQNTLIERAYMASIFQKKFMSIDVWLSALERVSREDIIITARQLRLQAVYFMEGK